MGGEESYGYLIGDFIRDKDAVTAAAVIAEIAAYCRERGISIYRYLLDIYRTNGCFFESMISLKLDGKTGMERMERIMDYFRDAAAGDMVESLGIIKTVDYQKAVISEAGVSRSLEGFPQSNVLQLFLRDNAKISLRPSGTEPKIKLYFSTWKQTSKDAEDCNIEQTFAELAAYNRNFERTFRNLAEAVE